MAYESDLDALLVEGCSIYWTSPLVEVADEKFSDFYFFFIFIDMKNTYTKEFLGKAVSESSSMVDLIRRLGVKYNGGNHSYLKMRIKKWNIDSSHFSRRGVNRGKVPVNKKHWTEVLVQNSDSKKRTELLRKALIESGVPYMCVNCGQKPVWNEKPLVIQIDHVDGDTFNNDRKNLRFLCPNCHTQTETFGSKNIKS